MAIVFDQIINLTEYSGNPAPKYVESLMIANEPDNTINQFFITDDRTYDKAATVDYANYSALQWSAVNSSLTSNRVSRIGVKSFPQIGAMAFFNLLNEEHSKILCPVYIKKTRYTRPTFSYTQSNGTISFTFESPSDITYIAWRVVMQNGDQAFEYVSYESTLTIDEPYLGGTYDTYVVGYVGEGEAVSDDSNHTSIVVTGTGADPLDVFDYYTKTDIDSMLGDIAALLDQLNGTVV